MSRPPRLNVSVDEHRLRALADASDVPTPLVKIMPGGRTTNEGQGEFRVAGDYAPATGTIRLFLSLHGTLEAARLPFVNSSLVHTFLHEFRHHVQQHTWTADQWKKDALQPYRLKDSEKDAESWAVLNMKGNRGLISVKRTYPGSGFSKLGKAERSVR